MLSWMILSGQFFNFPEVTVCIKKPDVYSSEPYKELFKYGSLSVEIYKPEEVDPQELNDQDEVYVVISSSLSW